MKNVLYLVCILATNCMFAQEAFDTEFFVSDFNDQPHADSKIEIYSTEGMLIMTKTTNNLGVFSTRLVDGDYHIKLIQANEIKKEAAVKIPRLEGNKIYNKVRIHVLYEEEAVFTIENLNFESGSAEILEQSFQILDKVVLFLQGNTEDQFEIAGHTDSDGSSADNLLLSEKRAQSVKEYLISKGIRPDQLQSKGYGESKPVASNDTPDGKSKNRRTELVRVEK